MHVYAKGKKEAKKKDRFSQTAFIPFLTDGNCHMR